MSQTIEQLLIPRSELERIYKGKVTLGLWKPLHKHVDSLESLHTQRGRSRLPNVAIISHYKLEYVIRRTTRGTSLFDTPETCSSPWLYFAIPAGTEIPGGLDITLDEHNEKYGVSHYSILPAHPMPRELFCKLLHDLAHNALPTAKESGEEVTPWPTSTSEP